MDLQSIYFFSEIVAAVAVIASLAFVGVQLRQNTTSVRAGAYQTWIQGANAEQLAGLEKSMAQTIASGLFDPQALTDENWVQFANYCNLFVQRAESAHYLSQDGVLPYSIAKNEFDRVAAWLTQPGPNQWWTAGARTQFTHEFSELIDMQIGKPTAFQVYSFTAGRGFHANA
jgi:hypothetical protein